VSPNWCYAGMDDMADAAGLQRIACETGFVKLLAPWQ